MVYLLRHLLSVLILPATMAVFVPVWIARSSGIGWRVPERTMDWAAVAGGCALLVVGLTLFGASLWHFAAHGRGTLAPWDPPRRLVVRGPYRYVRNPMISGVIFVLCGVALILRSAPHALWAAAFVAANFVYIPLVEEPQLEWRFGEPYFRYRASVPRFLPRVRPWRSGD